MILVLNVFNMKVTSKTQDEVRVQVSHCCKNPLSDEVANSSLCDAIFAIYSLFTCYINEKKI